MPFVESVYQFYVKYCSMMSIYVTLTTFLESAVLHSAGTQTAAILLAYCKTRGDGRDLWILFTTGVAALDEKRCLKYNSVHY